MRNFSITDTQWKRPGAELDDLGAACTSGTPILLVGNADEVQYFRRDFENVLDWLHDANATWEDVAPEKLVPGAARVICVSSARADYEKWRALWTERGFQENKDFFQADIFRPVFHLYKYGQVHIDRVEVFMTSHCTLNCEKCIAYIPYFQKKSHLPLELLTKDLDILFSKVDFVRKLKLLGGEGLMYPYLAEYIEYLFSHYSSHVGTVRVGTNATLLPSQRILDVCRKYGVIMDVSDYAMAVPGKCRMDELLALLCDQGIAYEIKRTGEQWLDIGFPDNPANFVKGPEAMEHFGKCAMFCRDFCDGKMWFCCSNFAAVRAGLYPENENDFLDLRTHVSKKMIGEYEIGFSHLGHTSFCCVCGGCSVEANPHAVPVAKQVAR